MATIGPIKRQMAFAWEFSLLDAVGTVIKIPDTSESLSQYNSHQCFGGYTAEEYNYAMVNRRNQSVYTYLFGRMALKHSISKVKNNLNLSEISILSNQYGAPVLPDSLKGSISHHDGYAVGLATTKCSYDIGVDITRYTRYPKEKPIPTHRLLTSEEIKRVGFLKSRCLFLFERTSISWL